jgi:hypothetical protein
MVNDTNGIRRPLNPNGETMSFLPELPAIGSTIKYRQPHGVVSIVKVTEHISRRTFKYRASGFAQWFGDVRKIVS